MADPSDKTPGWKFALAIAIGVGLSIPLFSVWFLVYDRQAQSAQASESITEGWGGPQTLSGPYLVIPYRTFATETLVESGSSVTRNREVKRELRIAPELSRLDTQIAPELRKRSIYEAVVYQARAQGVARFTFPPDLERSGIDPNSLDLHHAELRFGLSDPRGLGANPRVSANANELRLQPGQGSAGGTGFFSWLDASALTGKPIIVDYAFNFRGNSSLSLKPMAGETDWVAKSSWPSPSFGGGFLPDHRSVSDAGFAARYRIGNLALGQSIISSGESASGSPQVPDGKPVRADGGDGSSLAQINLIQPVDLYSRVNRAAKYGFLFIGFTFLALLMFDVIGGVRVSAVEYLLMGAALILFFVLLLALAELIGFTPAYLLASAAIAGLNTAYGAAVLNSWRRAAFIGGLLASLYAVLYVLLSLEAFSLLIGSILLFAALAGVMFATRNVDWTAKGGSDQTA